MKRSVREKAGEEAGAYIAYKLVDFARRRGEEEGPDESVKSRDP